MNIRVVSWNIAGGHPAASLAHLDYQPEDLEYFIGEIQNTAPDIVCLQEAHTLIGGEGSNAERIGVALGMSYVFNEPADVSHIDPKYSLGISVVSKVPVVEYKTTFFPNPHLESQWEGGCVARTHEKNLQVIDFGHFVVANTQLLPLSLFGHAYDSLFGRGLMQRIDAVVTEYTPSKPVVYCGDFNFDDPRAVHPFLLGRELIDALPDESTRPSRDGKKKRPDHIFYSPEFTLERAEVRKTNTDHYLCFADLSLDDTRSHE